MKLTALLIVITCILLTSCVNESKKEIVNNQEVSINKDSLPVQRFQIQNYGSYKVIVICSEKNSGDTAYSYVLYHRGTIKPKLNFSTTYVETPVRRVACLSSIYVGCLDKLNELDKIVAVDNKNYICNTFVRNKIATGEIKEISKTPVIDAEQTILLNPDLIISYGMGNPENDINKKIMSAGIPVAISVEYKETSPLAMANWLKFIAAFFEKDKMADSLLAITEQKYLALSKLVTRPKSKPTVFSEIKTGDTWFVPGGKSYMARLFNDAGANYIWKDDKQTANLPLSFEEVYDKANNSDFWLNVHDCNLLNDCLKKDERISTFRAFTTKNIYNNNAISTPEGGNSYWETGLMSPDEILADMIKIFHPELLPEHKLKYYKRLN